SKAIDNNFLTTSAAAYGSRRSPGRRGESVRPRSRGAFRPRFYKFVVPLEKRGRRESRVPTDTRGLVCQTHSNRRTRAYRFSRNSPAFPTQWLYGLLRALPGERAFLPPSSLRSLLLKNLAPASRRQDHTTSPYALAFSSGAITHTSRQSVHHIPRPTCRDDHDTPLLWARDRRSYNSDLQNCEAKYFSFRGLTLFLKIRISVRRANQLDLAQENRRPRGGNTVLPPSAFAQL